MYRWRSNKIAWFVCFFKSGVNHSDAIFPSLNIRQKAISIASFLKPVDSFTVKCLISFFRRDFILNRTAYWWWQVVPKFSEFTGIVLLSKDFLPLLKPILCSKQKKKKKKKRKKKSALLSHKQPCLYNFKLCVGHFLIRSSSSAM